MMIFRPKTLVLVDVCYYIPDTHVLNDFFWQTEDLVPDTPRIYKFLDYWKREIQAKIKEVKIAYGKNLEWRNVDNYDSIG